MHPKRMQLQGVRSQVHTRTQSARMCRTEPIATAATLKNLARDRLSLKTLGRNETARRRHAVCCLAPRV